MIIRVVQSKGLKDRHVMLPAEILDLLRQWWKARPTAYDTDLVPPRAGTKSWYPSLPSAESAANSFGTRELSQRAARSHLPPPLRFQAGREM